MKILKKQKQDIAVQVENQDDLWYLSHIIDPHDHVTSRTIRKIKLGEGEDRNTKIIKKPITITLDVERIEFADSILRISGKITQGPEDVSHGSYHTISIEPTSTLTIAKAQWYSFHKDKIDEATKPKKTHIIVCVFDRGIASIALLKNYGYTMLSEFSGQVQKKAFETQESTSFYDTIIKTLEEYTKRYDTQKIILASPAFFKEDLLKLIKNQDLKKKIILATCNNTGRNGINEVLKRPEVKEALKQDRISQELKVVDQLFTEISKNDRASYGIDHTNQAAQAGAIATLLITDSLITKTREEGTYEHIDAIMKTADATDAKIKIISSEHEGGKKLDGLGGIGAILRYKLS